MRTMRSRLDLRAEGVETPPRLWRSPPAPTLTVGLLQDRRRHLRKTGGSL
jgi:hypothetical protein